MSSDAAREKNRMILRSTDAACEKVIPKSTDAATDVVVHMGSQWETVILLLDIDVILWNTDVAFKHTLMILKISNQGNWRGTGK